MCVYEVLLFTVGVLAVYVQSAAQANKIFKQTLMRLTEAAEVVCLKFHKYFIHLESSLVNNTLK